MSNYLDKSIVLKVRTKLEPSGLAEKKKQKWKWQQSNVILSRYYKSFLIVPIPFSDDSEVKNNFLWEIIVSKVLK